jgi:hypothetical protein
MLDFPVNIRSQPSTSAGIIGKLGLHDEIEVLENTKKLQEIDGIEQYWYKINFNNIIGYIWGGYIAVGQYIFDIDKNGIKDYVYYRFRDDWRTIKTQDDIFIYINNKRIPIDIYFFSSEGYNSLYAFASSGYIYIKLGYIHPPSDPDYYVYIYRVNSSGNFSPVAIKINQTEDNFWEPTLEESVTRDKW